MGQLCRNQGVSVYCAHGIGETHAVNHATAVNRRKEGTRQRVINMSPCEHTAAMCLPPCLA